MRQLPDTVVLNIMQYVAVIAPKSLWTLYHTGSRIRRILQPRIANGHCPYCSSSKATNRLSDCTTYGSNGDYQDSPDSTHRCSHYSNDSQNSHSLRNACCNPIAAADSPQSVVVSFTEGSAITLVDTTTDSKTPNSSELWATAFRSLLLQVSLLFPPPDFLNVLARRHFQLMHYAVLAGSALTPQELAMALLIAIAAPNPSLARLLLGYGAALQLTDSWHPDPLHYAAEMGCNSICTMLIRTQAERDDQSVSSQTIQPHNSATHSSIDTTISKNETLKSNTTMCTKNAHGYGLTAMNAKYINREHPRYGRPLDRAVYARQFSTCQLLLALGATKKEEPLLIDAICYNDLDLCDWLLSDGADPNLSDRMGSDSPLYVAALVGNDEICQHLVAAGARLVPVALSTPNESTATPDALNKSTLVDSVPSTNALSINTCISNLISSPICQSPLFAAISGGHLRAFKSLLAMAKTYGVLRDMAPALFMEACRRGQSEMLQQLRSAGTFKNIDNSQLLSIAIDAGHAHICQILLDDIDFDIEDLEASEAEGQQTLLHRATWAQSTACCEVLVAAGMDVNGLNKGLDSSLHIAIESGSIELCKTLLKLGANVNSPNRSGETPLHYAAMHAQPAICVLLAEHGAHLYSQTNEGQTPLHLAIETASYNTCFSLVYEVGADVNATNRLGETPLHRAAMFAYFDICELLVMCGALINAISHVGATPLDFAMAEPESRLALYLKSHGALASSKLGEIVYTFRLRMKLES
ncbi:hypothetical protein BDV3_005675 [Batrachochytrium dendrobatidis]|nr:hypothetical protein O5D80_003783 [Batrachochytrium dendrobatidis]KAK5673487.1 hypothetical protein QVD99_000931 [Batrachochytrium dendrobatidis]